MLLAHVGRGIDGQHLAHGGCEFLFEVLGAFVFLPVLVAQVFPIELHAVFSAYAREAMREL